MTQEALKLVLEALYPIAHNTTDDPRGQAYKAITAIKEALAQTQEPLAYYHPHKGFYFAKPTSVSAPITVDVEPLVLYTTPPQRTWVGLTDDEIDQGLLRSDYAFKTAEAWRAGVVFAMTKLKEKNS